MVVINVCYGSRILKLHIVFILLAVAVGAPAEANTGNDRGWIELGLYQPTVDSLVQIGNDQTGQSGTILDLESDLNLKRRKALPSMSAGLPITKSIDLVVDFYQLSRRNSTQIDEEVDYDGVIYPINATLETEFNSTIYRVAASYNAIDTATLKVGISLGAHLTDFKTSIGGDITNPDGSVQFVRRQRKLLAPLPTLGISASIEVTPKVSLSGRIDALSLKIGDYKGRLVNSQIAAAYRIGRSWDVGVMYRYVDYRLKVRKEDWVGDVQYDFRGPAVFLRWHW